MSIEASGLGQLEPVYTILMFFGSSLFVLLCVSSIAAPLPVMCTFHGQRPMMKTVHVAPLLWQSKDLSHLRRDVQF